MIIVLKIILTILLILLAVFLYIFDRANKSKIFFDLLFQTMLLKLESLEETDEKIEEFDKYAQEVYDLKPSKVIHSIKPFNPKYWLSSECINYFKFLC